MHLLQQEWQDCLAGDRLDAGQIAERIRFLATGDGRARLEQAWGGFGRTGILRGEEGRARPLKMRKKRQKVRIMASERLTRASKPTKHHSIVAGLLMGPPLILTHP